MTELNDRVCATYLGTYPSRVAAYNQDPTYHHTFTRVAQVLNLFDELLTEAGHHHNQRREMLALLLEGPGDPATALRRVGEHAEAVDELMRQPPQPLPVTPELMGEVARSILAADADPPTDHRR